MNIDRVIQKVCQLVVFIFTSFCLSVSPIFSNQVMLSSKFYEQQNCGIFLTNYLFKVMIWFVMHLFSNLSRWSSNVFKMVRNFDNFWAHQRSFWLFDSSIKKLLKVSFEVNKLKLQHWENYIFKNFNYCQWKWIK